MAGWSATTSRPVILVCDFVISYGGQFMCFRNGKEDMKIPESVADSSGCHIPPKPGSDLGPWNCRR